MFIEDSMVVFVTRYHKGYQLSGDTKIIHRYLPQEVGELLVRYLWLVLPFQQQVETLMQERHTASGHIWCRDHNGKKWTSERMREALSDASMAALNCEMTIPAYREIAIGISRRFLRRSTAFRADDDEDGEKDEDEQQAEAQDLQSGHTAHIAGMIYARSLFDRSGEVASMRERFRTASTDWHQFFGIPISMGRGQGRGREAGEVGQGAWEPQAMPI